MLDQYWGFIKYFEPWYIGKFLKLMGKFSILLKDKYWSHINQPSGRPDSNSVHCQGIQIMFQNIAFGNFCKPEQKFFGNVAN